MKHSVFLLSIDGFVITAFSFVGMVFHKTQGPLVSEFARISAPFFLGICATAWAFEAYSAQACGKVFFRRSGLALVLGLLISVLLRSVQRGGLPSSEFLLPASFFFLILTCLLKGLYWLIALRGRVES